MRQERENRIVDQNQANQERVRNLAHEIKNPLGGIKGAAQLLEMELPEKELAGLQEYTQVIIRETERLQKLVDRLLTPHRMSSISIFMKCAREYALSFWPSTLKGSRSDATTIYRFLKSPVTRNDSSRQS